MKFKRQSEIRIQPLAEPVRFGTVLERSDLEDLKAAALSLDTTASEIIRVLVVDFLKSYQVGEFKLDRKD